MAASSWRRTRSLRPDANSSLRWLPSWVCRRSIQWRGAASYIDRILRGANPGELPVQLPTKYQLVINLKTAKALGLDVSSQLQQRADEMIE